MMNKILCIVGPTATGKTALALHLAQKYFSRQPCDLLSADSRQVYKEMNIGTGKDIPKEAVFKTTKLPEAPFLYTQYVLPHTTFWLIDQIFPNEEWSVAHFSSYCSPLFSYLHQHNTLPILVGGTGLYLKSLFHTYETLHIPQDLSLRQNLETHTIEQLQKELQQYNVQRFQSMNDSDKNNPRRLIRAIEVALYNNNHVGDVPNNSQHYNVFWIGLQRSMEELSQDIALRVQQRMDNGMVDEVCTLMKKYSDWTTPAFSATGYKETREYIEGKITKEACIQLWITREIQYAKRQMVWFKKQPNIHWFAAQNSDERQKIEKSFETWYHDTHETI